VIRYIKSVARRLFPSLKHARQHHLLAKAAKSGLSRDEQHELAHSVGKRVQDLPLSVRGGLMGVFFGKDGDGT
jgi:hypothetical protein